MKKRFKIILTLVFLFFLGASFFAFLRNPLAESGNPAEFIPSIRRALLKNTIAVNLLHSYHSFRKLPDLLFLPYFFQKSDLPQYSLYLPSQNIATLNSALPQDPIGGYLYDANRVWVNAIFTAGDYQAEVKVRYRGTNANHWNSLQKSFRIRFPNDKLFQGMRSLDLIIPYDRGYFVEPLNFYRAKKLGLNTLDLYFANLNLNGQNTGVYLAYESWGQEWLEKRKVPSDMLIFGYDDSTRPDDLTAIRSPYVLETDQGKGYWQNYTATERPGAFAALNDVLTKTDDATFRRLVGNILDLDKYFAFNVMYILSGSDHFGYTGNTFLLFNSATGRFEFSPWDVGVSSTSVVNGGVYDDKVFELSRRIFSFPEWRARRNELLKSYLSKNEGLKDDLAFYDNLLAQTKGDFYRDEAKLFNNLQWQSQVAAMRKMVRDNFNRASGVLAYDDNYYSSGGKQVRAATLNFSDSFVRFSESGYTIDEFIAANKSFVKKDKQTVLLPPGRHVFSRDVIIPAGLRVVIEPGALIYLGEKISMISYSPVQVAGTDDKPIRFLRSDSLKPWGVFAVLNTKDSKNVWKHVEFDGGSGGTFAGIIFTGMAAVHNGDVEITNSTFKNSGDDDALNVKFGTLILVDSVFQDTAADGVDIDFANPQTIVKNNKFYRLGNKPGGGDGIDISGSDINITDNVIDGCTDKGVSIGENSKPKVSRMRINRCDIGIAVKDSSSAEIQDAEITGSRVGISAYQKKKFFGGSTANVRNLKLSEVTTAYEQDALSVINVIK